MPRDRLRDQVVPASLSERHSGRMSRPAAMAAAIRSTMSCRWAEPRRTFGSSPLSRPGFYLSTPRKASSAASTSARLTGFWFALQDPSGPGSGAGGVEAAVRGSFLTSVILVRTSVVDRVDGLAQVAG